METLQKMEEQGIDESMLEAVEAYIALNTGDDDLDDFEEAYQGEWATDVDFVQVLLEGLGDIPEDLPAYIHIDWEGTTRDIMMDYSEQDGHYFRNL